jgi:hypothetical protein
MSNVIQVSGGTETNNTYKTEATFLFDNETHSIEEYQNLIELLKKALEFYADKKNYVQKAGGYNELTSRVELDGGSQAQFALEKIKELSEFNKNIENDFVKNITNAIENEENTENIFKLIEDFKNLKNEDNNI